MAGEVKGRLSQAMTTSDDIAASRLKYEKVKRESVINDVLDW